MSENLVQFYEYYKTTVSSDSDSSTELVSLKDNSYTNNYAGVTSAIVQFWGPFKVQMFGDRFIENEGIYTEAIKAYGCINPICSLSTLSKFKGSLNMHEYLTDGSILKYTRKQNQEIMFAMSILSFRETMLINTTGLEFRGNSFAE